MIKIKRTECPVCLNKTADKFSGNEYKKSDLKEALLDMQYGKCCFCERSLRDMGETERWAEHFIPKSSFKNAVGDINWYRANKWENLLYSCATCNGAKGAKLPFCQLTSKPIIIDPSCGDINPEDHIGFSIDGWIINYVEKDGSSLGRTTIDNLDLSRKNLFREFRRIKAEVGMFFADLLNALVDDDRSKIEQMKNELKRLTSAHLPFTAFKRSLIKKCIAEINEVDIPKLRERYEKSIEAISIDFLIGYEVEY